MDESSPAQWVVVVRSGVLLLNKVRCVGLGSVVCCLRDRKCLREYGGGVFMPESFTVLGVYKSWYLLMFYVLVCPRSVLSMGESGFERVVAFLVVTMLFSCV